MPLRVQQKEYRTNDALGLKRSLRALQGRQAELSELANTPSPPTPMVRLMIRPLVKGALFLPSEGGMGVIGMPVGGPRTQNAFKTLKTVLVFTCFGLCMRFGKRRGQHHGTQQLLTLQAQCMFLRSQGGVPWHGGRGTPCSCETSQYQWQGWHSFMW